MTTMEKSIWSRIDGGNGVWIWRKKSPLFLKGRRKRKRNERRGIGSENRRSIELWTHKSAFCRVQVTEPEILPSCNVNDVFYMLHAFDLSFRPDWRRLKVCTFLVALLWLVKERIEGVGLIVTSQLELLMQLPSSAAFLLCDRLQPGLRASFLRLG